MTDGATVEPAGGTRGAAPSAVGPGWEARLGGLCFAVGTLAVLVVAASLRPLADGYGTHEELGLPACVWMSTFDAPCPTCGMTTAFSYAAHGSYVRSFLAQPLGSVLAVGSAMIFWIGLHTALTGSRSLEAFGRVLGPRAVWWGLGALGAAWVYKLVQHGG